MTDPNTEGAELANLLIELEELEAEKKRITAQFTEEINIKKEAIKEKAHNSAQIPLPFSGE